MLDAQYTPAEISHALYAALWYHRAGRLTADHGYVLESIADIAAGHGTLKQRHAIQFLVEDYDTETAAL